MEENVNSGYLEFQKARVRWFLSVNSEYLPDDKKNQSPSTYRSITVDGNEIEFFWRIYRFAYDELQKHFGRLWLWAG